MSTARKTKPPAEGPPSDIATAAPRLLMFDTDRIDASRTNPRKSFDKPAHEELTASVRKDGILQPLLVRPAVTKDGMADASRVELVAGERRLRAARAAGLPQVPVIVRDLTDLEVLELQLVENLQRQDLTPLEEAEAYQALKETHGLTTAEIATKVKRSERSVLATIQLAKLPKVARELLASGALDASRALLIARVPVPDLADAAARLIAGKGTEKDKDRLGHYRDEPMSFRDARELIARRCCMRLDLASFPVADAQLVPKAGPCTTCPKRTGYQPELFADLVEINGKDSCTDPGCFNGKADAQWVRQAAEARAQGMKVVDAMKSPGGLKGLVALGNTCDLDLQYRSWKEVLGKDAPTSVLVRSRAAIVEEWVDEAAAKAVLKSKGTKLRGSSSSGYKAKPTVSSKVKKATRERDAKIGDELERRVVDAILPKVGKADELALRFIAHNLGRFSYGTTPEFRKRHGLKVPGIAQLDKLVAKTKAADLPRLMVDLIVSGDDACGCNGEKLGETLTLAAATFGVDVKPLRQAAVDAVSGKLEASIASKLKTAAAPKGKAKGKGKAKPKSKGKARR